MTEVTQEAIVEAIHKVEHPEIASSLVDLGMVRDISYSPDEKRVTLTLVLPFMGIPQAVRDYMINSLAKAVQPFGTDLYVNLAEMTPQERMAFMQKEQSLWRS